MIFDAGAVVIVPFPFADVGRTKPRPALVLSAAIDNEANGTAILAMITTAAKSAWPTDVPLKDLEAAGLNTACVVRSKLFTLDNRLISRSVGALTGRDRTAVRKTIQRLIAI
jgi:mRNA interferase MazF